MKGHISHVYSSDNTEVHLMVWVCKMFWGLFRFLDKVLTLFPHRHLTKITLLSSRLCNYKGPYTFVVRMHVCVIERERQEERDRDEWRVSQVLQLSPG